MRHRPVCHALARLLVVGCMSLIAAAGAAAAPPELTATVEGQRIPVVLGSHCWPKDPAQAPPAANACVEKANAPDLMAKQAPTIVQPNAEVELSFEDRPRQLAVAQWVRGKPTWLPPLNANRVVVPPTPGAYLYELHGTWEQGDASYIFAVQVGQGGPAPERTSYRRRRW